MPARADQRREGERKRRLLPVFLSALIVLPNNPLVAAAAAQTMSAAESAANAGSIGSGGSAASGAAGIAATAPAPLALTPQAFAAPLTAASLIAAPGPTMADAGPKLFAAPAAGAPALAASSIRPTAASASREIASAALPAAALPRDLAAASLPIPAALAGFGRAAAPRSGSALFPKADAAAESGSESSGASPRFDGARNRGGDATVFIVRHGQAPISAKLSALGTVLKDQPEIAASLNKNGNVRLVFGGAAGQDLASTPEFKAKYPTAVGAPEVSPVQQAWGGVIGNPLVKLALYPIRLLRGKASLPNLSLSGLVSLPVRVWRETRFLGRTFADSMTKPLPSEVLGGIATKSYPLTASLIVYWTTVGLAHPLAMGGLMTLSLFQETFHGIFLNTWNNFQNSLSRLRGFAYQMNFNLIYMQGFGAMYRALSWSANPGKTIPPWSPFYWQDVLVMSLVGTFFGTLGYNGLNTLYAKGRLKRWQRSGIQQLRDVLFLLAGPFFATGSMHAFWGLFIFQQALDLTIAILAWRARTRTTLYVVPEGGSRSGDEEHLTKTLRDGGVSAPVTVEKLSTEGSR